MCIRSNEGLYVNKPEIKKWPNRIQGTRHHAKNKARGTHKPTLRMQYKPSQWQTKSGQFQNLVVVRCTCHTLYTLGQHRINSGHKVAEPDREQEWVNDWIELFGLVRFSDFLIFGFSPEIQTLMDYRLHRGIPF